MENYDIMSFDFNGVKANLEGINKYLESNEIDLSNNESKTLVSIFNDVDSLVHKNGERGYKDGQLDMSEEKEFDNRIAASLPKIKEKIQEFFNGIREEYGKNYKASKNTAKNDNTYVNNNILSNERTNKELHLKTTGRINDSMNYKREDILHIALDQAIKRMPEVKKIEPSSARIEKVKTKYPQAYKKALEKANNVTDMVMKNCKKYEVADLMPVIATMLGAENGGFDFSSKVLVHGNSTHKGVMQTDLKSIENLYKDKDSVDVKFINELKRTYKTPKELYNKIQSNVELGLQVGILVLKAKIRGANGNVAKGVKNYCGNQYKYDYSNIKTVKTVTV